MTTIDLMPGNFIIVNNEPKRVDWRVIQDYEKKIATGDKIEYYRDMTFESIPVTKFGIDLIGFKETLSNNIITTYESECGMFKVKQFNDDGMTTLHYSGYTHAYDVTSVSHLQNILRVIFNKLT